MNESDIIVSYIERKGWRSTRVNDGWGVRQAEGETEFYLSFTPSWICLQAPLDAYLDSAGWDDRQWVRLYRDLLRHNEEMFMGKFCRDQAGQLTLQVELPNSGSIHRIDYALDALTRYLKLYRSALGNSEARQAPAAVDRTSKDLYFDAPPGIPHEVIAYYIRAVEPHGWGARSKPKGITWLLGYKGQRMFDVYLTVTKSWSYFHVPSLLETPAYPKEENPAIQRAFLEYLLQINDAWYLAKTGMNEAHQVLAMLEIPTQELDFEMFRLVTRLLSTYLDLYAREIQIMSLLPSDPKLLEKIVAV
jgi:hypothetical protein